MVLAHSLSRSLISRGSESKERLEPDHWSSLQGIDLDDTANQSILSSSVSEHKPYSGYPPTGPPTPIRSATEDRAKLGNEPEEPLDRIGPVPEESIARSSCFNIPFLPPNLKTETEEPGLNRSGEEESGPTHFKHEETNGFRDDQVALAVDTPSNLECRSEYEPFELMYDPILKLYFNPVRHNNISSSASLLVYSFCRERISTSIVIPRFFPSDNII